ncbi:MAG TPA: PAS domain S-box protein [Opitutaceae bacterium]
MTQLVNENPDPVLVIDSEGVVLFSNRQARQVLRDGAPVEGQGSPLPGGPGETASVHLPDAKGKMRRFERFATPMKWGKKAAWMVTLRDSSGIVAIEQQLTRINRLYSALGQTARACGRSTRDIELFEDVCRIAVAFGGFRISRIARANATKREMRDVASAGAVSSHVSEWRLPLDPSTVGGQGPAARTLRLGVPYVCNDLLADPVARLWHEMARRDRLASMAAYPINVGGITDAVWIVYASETGFFDSTLLNLLGQMAAEIGAALERLAGREARHRAERALSQSEALFRQMAEANRHVFWMRDLETHKLLYVSPAFETVFGRPLSEAPKDYTEWLALLHPEDRSRFEGMLKRGKSDRPTKHRYRITRPDGSIRWVEDEIIPIHEDGRMVRISGNLSDITDQLAANQQVEFFRELVSTSSDGFFILSAHPDWRVVFINRAGAAHLGYAPDVLQRMHIWEWDATLTPDACRTTWEALAHQKTARFESLHRRFDNSTVKVEMVLNPIAHQGEVFLAGWFRDISARARAEAQLRESEEQFHSIFDEAADPLVILDSRSMRVLDCNRRALEIFDAPDKGQLVGLDGNALQVQPFSDQQLRSMLAQVKTGNALLRELEFTSLKGRRFWVMIVARKISEAGRTLILVRMIDITECWRLAEILAESQKVARMGGWEYRIDQNHLTWTEGVYLIHELEPGSPVDIERSVDYYVPKDRPQVTAAFREAVRNGTEFKLELCLTTAKGREIWVRLDGRADLSEGHPWRLHGMVQDITEEHFARKALEEREDRLAQQAMLLDEANDAIILRSLHGGVLYWNRGAERLLGWSADEAGRIKDGDFCFRDASAVQRHIQTVKADGSWQGELELATKAAGTVTVESRWTLIRDKDGRPTSVLTISTDITERKRMEASFIRTQRLENIGTLAGGIAHDLNNILSPILLSSDLLRLQLAGTPESEFVEAISSSARRGAEVVRQILSFSRGVNSGTVAFDMRPLIDDIGRLVQETFPRNIRFESSNPRRIRLVRADPTQMHQVLLNLCVNARDAMPDGGLIRIDVSNVNGPNDEPRATVFPSIRIQVSDTGTGIPEGICEHIFEPFFTTKPDGQGTGFGLSTVSAIVQRHGGSVMVDTTPGEGSTFTVFFLTTQSGAGEKGMDVIRRLPMGHGETILVIDDEKSVCSMTRQSLESSGYRVVTAEDGAEGISKFTQNQNDIALVLTDIMMPVMDGHLVIQSLRNLAPQLKVIAMSGVADASGSGSPAAKFDQPVHFLLKPFTMEALLVAVRKALETPAPSTSPELPEHALDT